jgi:glycosyltransferase involved in cell wall biosynthesis
MAAKLRLMHVIGAAKAGGAETFALRLMTALHQHVGVEQQILCRKGWLSARLTERGIPHHIAPFGGVWDKTLPFFTHRKSAHVATQFKPDVILAWMNRGVSFVPQGPWAKVARLGGFYNLKYYHNRVQHLVGNTPEIVTYCKAQGWPAEHVHLLHNFIPAAPMGWREQYRDAQRMAWGWGEGDIGLVQVGRLHHNKGCDITLQALALLPEHYKLAFVGEGPDRVALKTLATELGITQRVVFAGWANAVEKIAAPADMWLAPSRHEPLGNTAIDAWVHGVPLVVSAVGGLDALVEEGVHGLKVPPEDPAALAEAITRYTANPALQSKVCKGGTARWLAEYSESRVVSDYLGLFAKLSKTH